MAKFITLWEMDYSKLPDDPEERIRILMKNCNMTKENLKSGAASDWGSFAGSRAGYSIHEGTEEEVALETMKFSPYVKFTVYPVLSVDQVLENIKKLTKK